MANAALRAALARDAATFLGDFGSTVTFGSLSAPGVLSLRDDPVEQGGFVVMQRRTVLRIVAGALPGLGDAQKVTVDGVTYRVDGDAMPVPPDGVHVDFLLVGAP